MPRVDIWSHGTQFGSIDIARTSLQLDSSELRNAIGTRTLSLNSIEFQGCDVGVNPPVLAAFGRMVGAKEITAWTQTHVLVEIAFHPEGGQWVPEADAKSIAKRMKFLEHFLPAGIPRQEAAIAVHLRSLGRNRPFPVMLEYWSREGSLDRKFEQFARTPVDRLQDEFGFGFRATGRRQAKQLSLRAAEATKPLFDLPTPATPELMKVTITFP